MCSCRTSVVASRTRPPRSTLAVRTCATACARRVVDDAPCRGPHSTPRGCAHVAARLDSRPRVAFCCVSVERLSTLSARLGVEGRGVEGLCAHNDRDLTASLASGPRDGGKGRGGERVVGGQRAGAMKCAVVHGGARTAGEALRGPTSQRHQQHHRDERHMCAPPRAYRNARWNARARAHGKSRGARSSPARLGSRRSGRR